MHTLQFFTHITGSLLITRIDNPETGPVLFTLDIREITHFFSVDNHLLVRQNNQQEMVLLRDNLAPDDAQHLLNMLTDTLIKHQKSHRLTRRVAGDLAFLAVCAVAISLLMPTKTAVSHDEPAALPVTLINPDPTRQATQEALATLANNLAQATTRQLFTVPLTTGHPRTLYVFSAPLCPYYRDIEPTLEAMGKNYNIEIFPVTLVGKQHTADHVIPVLCAPLPRGVKDSGRCLMTTPTRLPLPVKLAREH